MPHPANSSACAKASGSSENSNSCGCGVSTAPADSNWEAQRAKSSRMFPAGRGGGSASRMPSLSPQPEGRTQSAVPEKAPLMPVPRDGSGESSAESNGVF